MPLVNVRDLSMYYEIHGEGPNLILLLGLALDISEMGGLTRRLSEHYRVVVVDNRGAGRTSAPPGPYSISMMADDVVGLMDALSIADARVVGISMGAKIALELAWHHQTRVKDLVLIGAQCQSSLERRTPLLLRLAFAVHALGIGQGAYPQSSAAFEAQRHASASYDCVVGLSSIRAHTLVLHGRRDRFAPWRQAVQIASVIPDASLRTFPGGHYFFFRRSYTDIVDAIVNF